MKFTCSSGYKNIDGDFLYIGQRILESLMSTEHLVNASQGIESDFARNSFLAQQDLPQL